MQKTEDIRLAKVLEILKAKNFRFPNAKVSERLSYDPGNLSAILKGKKPMPDNFFTDFIQAFGSEKDKQMLTEDGTILIDNKKDGIKNEKLAPTTPDNITELIRSNQQIGEALLIQARASDKVADTNAKLVQMMERATVTDPLNTVEALTDKILELQGFLLKVATGQRFDNIQEAVQALGSGEKNERRSGIPSGGHN